MVYREPLDVPSIQARVRARDEAYDPRTWERLEAEFDHTPFREIVALLPDPSAFCRCAYLTANCHEHAR